MVRQVGLQPVLGDFGCVLGCQATKSTVRVRPKELSCVNFGQEWHLPPQHPSCGSKLSSKGKPETCALLETLQSPVVVILFLQCCGTRTGPGTVGLNFLTRGTGTVTVTYKKVRTGTVINYGSGTGTRYEIRYLISFI
jgi:hypothetical protein